MPSSGNDYPDGGNRAEEEALASENAEEEIEYEEVEVVEEIEVEEEVEVEEDDEDYEVRIPQDPCNEGARSNSPSKPEDEELKRKHSRLLSLPPHGSQIYIGGIPNDISDSDLKAFCESIGEVHEVRIMKEKDSNVNKGFAFVTFINEDLASKAISELHNANLKGKQVKCSTSQAKNRLFINNVPRHWQEDDLRNVVEEVGPGVTSLQLVKDINNTGNNRGFAFVDYYNNACADYARQRMLNPKFKLGSNSPTVNWAESKNPDSSSTQVKAIYIKNLPDTVTQEKLTMLFKSHGSIDRVVIPAKKTGQENKRIAFVHFNERSSALKALENNVKHELDGKILDCSLAKPWSDQKPVSRLNLQKEGLLPNHPPHMGHGLLGNPYGYESSSYSKPLIYGSMMSPDMAMTPLVLPDGQIGYILQPNGGHVESMERRHRNGSRNGGSSSRRNYDYNSGSRYRPY